MKSCNILETNSQSQAVECPMLPFIRPRRRGKAILGSPELDFSASDKHSVLRVPQKKCSPSNTCYGGLEVALHCRRPAARRRTAGLQSARGPKAPTSLLTEHTLQLFFLRQIARHFRYTACSSKRRAGAPLASAFFSRPNYHGGAEGNCPQYQTTSDDDTRRFIQRLATHLQP